MRDEVNQSKDKTKDVSDKTNQPSDLNSLSIGVAIVPVAVAAARIMAQFPKVDIERRTPTTRWLTEGGFGKNDQNQIAQLFKDSYMG